MLGAYSPTPISVYGLPLQRLALSADYHTGDFDFRHFRGGFAGGEIEGRAQLEKSIERTRKLMQEAAKKLDFIEAAQYRDEVLKMEELLKEKTE